MQLANKETTPSMFFERTVSDPAYNATLSHITVCFILCHDKLAFVQFVQRCEVLISASQQQFRLAPMGVLAPGSAHARPSARPPIDTSEKISAHVSAE